VCVLNKNKFRFGADKRPMEAMAVTGNTLHNAAWTEIFKKRRRPINIFKNVLLFTKRFAFPFKKKVASNFIHSVLPYGLEAEAQDFVSESSPNRRPKYKCL